MWPRTGNECPTLSEPTSMYLLNRSRRWLATDSTEISSTSGCADRTLRVSATLPLARASASRSSSAEYRCSLLTPNVVDSNALVSNAVNSVMAFPSRILLFHRLPPRHPVADPIQAEIAVGDPKQSIYRFRRADVAQMKRLQQRMEGAGGRTVSLVQNFRSQKGLIAWVNHLFEVRWAGHTNEAATLRRHSTHLSEVLAQLGISLYHRTMKRS